MATQTTGGGSSTSFTNTPQAGDDSYWYTEDWLRTSGYYDTTTKVVTLDVMSNDLGGNAKSLFSIDDGNGNVLEPDFQLLCKDVNAAGCSPWELTPDGNWIRINNGKIEFKLGNPDAPLDHTQALDLNSLAAGECIDDEFVYAIRLANGALSQATVHIHITGENDGPDAVADTDTTDEDNSILVDVLANDTDPDTSDTLTISDADVTSGLGSVAIESGKLRYDPGSAYNYLAVGETAEVVITYSISDGNGGSDTATLTVTVTGTNDGPDAVADTDTTDEDNSILVDVLANDTDPDTSDTLTISDADVTSGLGSVAIESGKLRYDPGSAYNYLAVGETAEVVITYSISDGNGGSDTATLTVTVTGTNDGPDAVADTDTTDEDNSILVDVLANDTDPDTSDTLTISDADVTSGLGSVAIESGKLRYDPGSAYNYLAVGETAEVVITYSISDGNGGSDTATLTVTVTGTNDGPDAVADTDTTDEDNSILVDVLANDTDPDTSDTLTISDADVTSGLGSVAIESGKLRYDPGSAYNYLAVGETAEVVITYSISDGNGGSDTATLTVTVTGTNDGPDAVADTDTTDEDNSILVDVLANDTDPDTSDTLTISDADVTSGLGSVAIESGKLRYDPGSAYNYLAVGETAEVVITYSISDGNGGSDTATLTVTVTGTNDGPDAVADTDTTDEDNSILVDVLANDTDPDTSDTLTISDADVTSGLGSVAIESGKLRYDPGSAYNYLAVGETAEVVITYSISDGNGGSDTATLTVTVTGTNDGPDAVADTDTTDEDNSILVDVLANDTDPDTSDTLTISDADVTSGLGSVAIESGKLRYDPGSAYNYLAVGETAEVVITYSISDGNGGSDTATLTVTVTGTNDGPDAVADTDTTDEDNSILVDVLANDTDPDTSDTLTISDADVTSGLGSVAIESGKLRYDPGSAYNYLAVGETAEVVITYSISDGNGGSDTATLTVTVTGTNDGPDAVADTDTTDEDNSILVDVLANDTDPDTSDTLTISDADVTSGLGSVAIESGKLRYDPGSAYNYLAVGETAEVVITYSISDGNGGSDTATLTVTVTGTNDGPDAVADTDTTDEDNSILVDVLANDTDPDTSDTLTISDADVTSGLGSVAIESGKLRYDPGSAYNYLAVGETAEVVITYSISDGNGGSDTATLTVTVTGTNDGPAITSNGGGDTAFVLTQENTTAVTTVIATDVDSANITYSIVGGADMAKFTIDPNTGALSFVSSPDFENPADAGGNNVYDIIVRASDGAASDDQAIAVTVTDVAEGVAPAAGDDVWVLSDTAIPDGTISLEWVINNDTDLDGPTLFITSVSNLPPWLTANFIGGQLVSFSVTGPAVAGTYSLTYTLSDGTLTDAGSISITVLNTTDGNPGDSFTLDGNDFSYVDLQTGPDTINGDITLMGKAGTDIFLGSNGNDQLFGGAGNDRLLGGQGDDELSGGDGADFLDGGSNTDTLSGGAGNDFFVLNPAGGTADTITDYAAGDVVNINGFLSVSAGTNVIGGGYLRVTAAGEIQVDANGGANNFQTIGFINTGVSPTIQYLSGGVTVSITVTPVAPPIALDLDGDGQISFLGTHDGAQFDYGAGKVQTAWVAANDGILVRDANNDGEISADEIVFATSGSDLEGLARYDSNGDGQLSAVDAGFDEFGVWQDADSDGEVDAGELQSLAAHSIASISLTSDGHSYTAANGDVTVVGTGSFTRTDGSTGMLADAVFNTGGKVVEEARAQAALGNSSILLGAVAAAGLIALPAAAHEVKAEALDLDASTLHHSGWERATSAGESVGAVDLVASFGPEASLSPSGAHQGSADFTKLGEMNHSLIGAERVEAVELVHQSAAIDFPSFQAADLQAPVAPAMVAMPSAEALLAAFDAQSTGAAEKIAVEALTEALEGNLADADINALLEAALPTQAPELAALGDGLFQSHSGPANLSIEAYGPLGMSGAQQATILEHMAVHPDAIQQA